MTPVEALKLISVELIKEEWQFAVCGGVAASIYRADVRLTNDLDIAIALPGRNDGHTERLLAIRFLERLGLKTLLGWFPGTAQDDSNVFSVIGKGEGFFPSIDLLLPSLPWLRTAVSRAQKNLIDYGFALLPTITPEDCIISKAYALRRDPTRPNDRSDILSILDNGEVEEPAYLEKTLTELGLTLPRNL